MSNININKHNAFQWFLVYASILIISGCATFELYYEVKGQVGDNANDLTCGRSGTNIWDYKVEEISARYSLVVVDSKLYFSLFTRASIPFEGSSNGISVSPYSEVTLERCSGSSSEAKNGCRVTNLLPNFFSVYTYEIPLDTEYIVTPKIVSKSGVLESQALKISKSWRLSVPAINC